jgi:putative tricarboxylic transport membrane protein
VAESDEHQGDRADPSTQTVEATLAALLLAVGLVVMWDSVRIGFRWADDGPQAGYFPFYVGVLLSFAAAVTFLRALRMRTSLPFVAASALKSILTMLVPTIVYVAAVAWLGLYVASFVYIAFFMMWIGRYSWPRSLAVSLGVSVAAFLLFEVWFSVPLPKGPLESMLGLA